QRENQRDHAADAKPPRMAGALSSRWARGREHLRYRSDLALLRMDLARQCVNCRLGVALVAHMCRSLFKFSSSGKVPCYFIVWRERPWRGQQPPSKPPRLTTYAERL